MPEKWPWLGEIFGHLDDFRTALCAYYMTLNILELADTIAKGNTAVLEANLYQIDVPIRFPAMPRDIVRKAYRLLLRHSEQVKGIWEGMKISEPIMRENWPKWMKYLSKILRREYVFHDIEVWFPPRSPVMWGRTFKA